MTSPIPNYDALFCGKQPLDQNGAIQPHGILLIVNKSNFRILQVSENILTILPFKAAELLDKPLISILDSDSFAEIETKTLKGNFNNRQVIKATFLKGDIEEKYVASIHEKDETLLIEVEFANTVSETDSGGNLFQPVNDILLAIEAATTVEEICNITAVEIKQWSGFDKVMIYWFDEEWNGTVIAQAMEPGMDDYLGLKFPASDIPKPARDLYFKNPVRLIPDSSYTPVSLIPSTNPLTGLHTDLSGCKLRNVVSVHLEYLKNMGVVASMSTRIIHNNKLGGLISCHHRTPKFLTHRQISAFEIISAVISSKISMTLNSEAEQIKAAGNLHRNALLQKVHLQGRIAEGLMESKDLLLQFLHAEGVVITGDGKFVKAGSVPGDKQVMELVQWLQDQKFGSILHLPSLPLVFAPAAAYCEVASGILAITIQAERGNFLIAFRQEVARTVAWGGNPNDALTFEPGSTIYHPRNSFKLWKETSKCSAIPWTREEIEVMEQFRNDLVTFELEQKNEEIGTVLKEFRMVTDIIPQLIFSTSPQGQMDYCNQQWKNYTGFEPEEIMTLGWTLFLHPDEAERIKHDFDVCLQTQVPFNAECRLRNIDDAYRWFLVKALPLKDNKGITLKWYGSCTDIDEQKRMEEVLEQQVEARTRELKKTNLELEEINEELEQFVKVASHDLQEQVRKIQIFSNVTREQLLQSEENEGLPYVDKIIAASFRLRKLIVDLLIYSDLSRRGDFISVDVNQVIKDVQDELSQVIEERKAIITSQNLPVMDAIKGEMKLLFKNLISNSIDFSKADKIPEIHIEAQRVSKLDFEAAVNNEGEFVRITVTDNGIGFENQYSELIFQVFQKLVGKQKSDGTGIGLAIVKKIIDKYHGIIKASGRPNEGAEFTLVLPLKQADI